MEPTRFDPRVLIEPVHEQNLQRVKALMD